MRRSGTGQGTLLVVRDGSLDPLGGLGWVGIPMERYGTGRGTVEEVRYGTWIFPEVRDELRDLEEVRDMLMDPPGGSGQVGKPS